MIRMNAVKEQVLLKCDSDSPRPKPLFKDVSLLSALLRAPLLAAVTSLKSTVMIDTGLSFRTWIDHMTVSMLWYVTLI